VYTGFGGCLRTDPYTRLLDARSLMNAGESELQQPHGDRNVNTFEAQLQVTGDVDIVVEISSFVPLVEVL
jgi:hypothetical protein